MHNTAKKTVTKMLQLLSVRILSFPAIIRLSSFKIVWGSHCGNVPAAGLFGVYRVILIPANLKINKKSQGIQNTSVHFGNWLTTHSRDSPYSFASLDHSSFASIYWGNAENRSQALFSNISSHLSNILILLYHPSPKIQHHSFLFLYRI